jgi:hypothetical protein
VAAGEVIPVGKGSIVASRKPTWVSLMAVIETEPFIIDLERGFQEQQIQITIDSTFEKQL